MKKEFIAIFLLFVKNHGNGNNNEGVTILKLLAEPLLVKSIKLNINE